ncbi:MAG: hypothetical protein IJW82_02635 [Clostridia bacterium]|nr:hypothetical protein [Clostridia bacterium]
MYCIKCGVKLSDTEKVCPLCNTVVYHPTLQQENVKPLYPKNNIPKVQANPKAFNGMFIILFFIPMLICLFSDLQSDGHLEWFGFAAGGLIVGYLIIALPLWFKKPNPVIFVPCDFAAITLYLLYINIVTNGNWFLSFAFPITITLCLIVCTVVTLNHYLHKGKLYIFGGGFMGLALLLLLIEFLLDLTFYVEFIGWSLYPLVILFFLGGSLIYLGINTSAREIMERKLFF